MANKRQRKKAQKRAQRELKRLREQQAMLDELDMSIVERDAIDRLVQRVQIDDQHIETETEKEMRQEAADAAKSVSIPAPPQPLPEPAAPVTPAPTVEAPRARSIAQRAKEAPAALGGLFATTLGNIRLGAPTDEQKKTRSEIVKINNQLILTTKIIDANKEELGKLAATDASVAKILEVSSSDQLQSIKDLQDRILAGQEISADDSKDLISKLEEVTSTISSTQVSLEARFSDISSSFEKLILDDNLDRDDRRAMLEELVKISNSSDLQAQFSDEQKKSLKELETLSNSNLNFSSEQNAQLAGIFKQLKSEDLDKVKLRGTLNDLNESMESAVLTNDELKDRLDEKDDSGSSLRSRAGEGISSLGKTLKAGAIDYLLAQVGLGGLGIGETVSDLGLGGLAGGVLGAGRGIGKGAGAIGRGLGAAGRFGGKTAGMLGKGLGFAGRVAGKAALPLAAAMSLYDAYKGFTNADEVAGVEPGGKASMGQKFGAAGASVLSGLTFGLAGDPKEIYAGIASGVGKLLGEDGILTKTGQFLKKALSFTPIGFIIANFDSIRKGLGDVFGEEGIIMKMAKFLTDIPSMIFSTVTDIFTDPQSLIAKVKESFSMMFDFLFGDEGIFSLETAKKALKTAAGSVLPDFITSRIDSFSGGSAKSVSEPQVAKVNSRAADLAIADDQRARAAREEQLSVSREGKTIIVPAAAPSSPPPVSRSPKVDDLSLAVMNAGMAGV